MTKQLQRLIDNNLIDLSSIMLDINNNYCMCELVSKYKLTTNILKEIAKEFCNNKIIFGGLSEKIIQNSKPLDIEELRYLYLEKDYSYADLQVIYGLTGYSLDNILRDNNIKKSRKQSALSVKQMKAKIYGLDNITNSEKGHETRIKNSGSLEESYKKGLIKQQQTCLERYGYMCAFSNPKIRSHRKKKNSGPNLKFKSLLESANVNNLKIETEFVIGLKSYDFKINQYLIEINPSATHKSTFCPFSDGKPRDKYYHQNKTKLALENGYICIHIWDWTDKDLIIKQLLENTLPNIIGFEEPRKYIYHTKENRLVDIESEDTVTIWDDGVNYSED